ncbi:MAG: hemerythrin domain-containing protein [Tissierellaceae bacterium]
MTNWEDASYSEIIENILRNHHAYLKRELPEIERLGFTLYKVHFFDSGEVLERVHKLFGCLKTTLESHIIKEERSLFHMIRDYEKEPSMELLDSILDGIQSAERDNLESMNILKELRQVTDGYKLPPTSCQTYETTYKKLKELESGLHKHIGLENDILFERLRNEK